LKYNSSPIPATSAKPEEFQLISSRKISHVRRVTCIYFLILTTWAAHALIVPKKKKDVNAFETGQLLGFATLRRIPSIVKNLHNTECTEVACRQRDSFARWPVASRLLRTFRRKTTTSRKG
jgi:hypothetical protein